MKFNKRASYLSLPLFAIALLFPPAPVRAQAIKGQETALPNQKSEKQTEEKNEGMEALKSKVDRLQSLVEQQQRALEQLQKRLDETEGKAKTASLVSSNADTTVAPRPASLETNQAANSAPAATQAKAQEKPVVVAGWDKNHAFLRSTDGRFETRLTGYAQLDGRAYQSGNHPPNTFLIRRARMSLEGRLERYFDFKVEGDFADTANTLLRDFYLDIHRNDEVRFRFGQFKEPFSQEELRSDANQDFVERSLVNNLAPSRSPGLMVHGLFNKDRTGEFEYQVGTFNGKGLLALNNNNTPESVLRLRFSPWKTENGSLAIGGAYAQGRSIGGAGVRGQTESRSVTFYAPDTVNGKLIRANGEMTWLYKSASIRAEYDQTNQDRDNLGPGGRNLPGVVAKGYMAQATYLLTGEKKPDGLRLEDSVTPRRNLFGDEKGNPGFGAFELKFRYANLQIANGTAKTNRAETFFFGPNWYMNRFVKYVLDLGIERFKDPVRSPKPGDKNYFVILSRVQVVF